jgi:TATA-box binding protein (TBP) (component of TFIID and TFIIIB)
MATGEKYEKLFQILKYNNVQYENTKDDNKIFNFLKKNKTLIDKNTITSTKLTISTKSAKAKLTGWFDIAECASIIYNVIENEGNKKIIGIQYKDYDINMKKKKKRKVMQKGSSKKILVDKQKFSNQATITIKTRHDLEPTNIKIFINGVITMTGCKQKNDETKALNILIKEINKHTNQKVFVEDIEVTLINSDFNIGFKIDRLKLNNIIKRDYDLFSLFEPINYPGVKISYYWNNNNVHNEGICTCKNKCIVSKATKVKNGNGYGDSHCRKVTIIVFSSGCILITGAQEEKQSNDAYKFICQLLFNYYDDIVKYSIDDIIKYGTNTAIIKIKKDKKETGEDKVKVKKEKLKTRKTTYVKKKK